MQPPRLLSSAALALLILVPTVSAARADGAPSRAHPGGAPSRAHPGGASSGTRPEIGVRALVQQGLAIGLASNVLQSQVTVLADAELGSNGCAALAEGGGGASRLLSRTTVAGVAHDRIALYYDTSCAHPYIVAAAAITTDGENVAIAETASYLGRSGAPLGVLRLREVADTGASRIDVHGTGVFTPHDGAPPVSLGLTCSLPNTTGTPPPFSCSGGIAQSFPALGVSIASVTPLTLTLASTGASQYAVSFAGTHATVETGAAGALSIASSGASLAIAGTGTPSASDVTAGRAGRFALFPPTPTAWSITSAADHTTFAIAVTNDARRSLAGTVRTEGGTTLARLAIDQSGSGTITYANASVAPILNWTLGG